MYIKGTNYQISAYETLAKNSASTVEQAKGSLVDALNEENSKSSTGFDTVTLSEEALSMLNETNPDILKELGYLPESELMEDVKAEATEKYFYLNDEYIEFPPSLEELGYESLLEALKGLSSENVSSEEKQALYEAIANENASASQSYEKFISMMNSGTLLDNL